MARFQDVETETPVILTTSQLLTTGLDAPTCKNIVLARVVGSMTEFKQIIGRGSRVRDDYGKFWFSILDYTGSATRMFADPDFDGEPVLVTETEIDSKGEPKKEDVIEERLVDPETPVEPEPAIIVEPPSADGRKFYVDRGHVEIAAHLVYELDPDGRRLRVVRFTDCAGEKVRTLFSSAPANVIEQLKNGVNAMRMPSTIY
jgi:type I restriction enzyme R subunit